MEVVKGVAARSASNCYEIIRLARVLLFTEAIKLDSVAALKRQIDASTTFDVAILLLHLVDELM
jgi:hypothetical protein